MPGLGPGLFEVLPEQVKVTRQFWLYYGGDLRKLEGIILVADYRRACAQRNRAVLLGETAERVIV